MCVGGIWRSVRAVCGRVWYQETTSRPADIFTCHSLLTHPPVRHHKRTLASRMARAERGGKCVSIVCVLGKRGEVNFSAVEASHFATNACRRLRACGQPLLCLNKVAMLRGATCWFNPSKWSLLWRQSLCLLKALKHHHSISSPSHNLLPHLCHIWMLRPQRERDRHHSNLTPHTMHMPQAERSAGLEQDVAGLLHPSPPSITSSSPAHLNLPLPRRVHPEPTTPTEHHAVLPPLLGLGYAAPPVHDFSRGWVCIRPSPR